MQPQYKNKFGRVDLNVSAFGFGTAPVGNIFKEIDRKPISLHPGLGSSML